MNQLDYAFFFLVAGLAMQLFYQALFRSERKLDFGTTIAMANLAALLVVGVGQHSVRSASGPPPKFNFSKETEFTYEEVTRCVSLASRVEGASFAVSQHSRGGYGVEIWGKNLSLSIDEEGTWEKIYFYMDVEGFKDSTRLQFVGLEGSFAYSSMDDLPPAGGRWEPIGGTSMSFLRDRIDSIFSRIASCMGGTAA